MAPGGAAGALVSATAGRAGGSRAGERGEPPAVGGRLAGGAARLVCEVPEHGAGRQQRDGS
ncbi:hypothetical protein NDU88_001515, partial [Pleurodeles waltl]